VFDANIQISDRDVTPTNRIMGNIFGTYSGLNITIKFKDPKDPAGISTMALCKGPSVVSGFSNYTTLLLDTALNPVKLPIGGIEITTNLYYKKPTFIGCQDNSTPRSTKNYLYFVSDNINQIILPELR
jgi:hypothetical protein